MTAIIDYQAGNTESVRNALLRCGESSVITSNSDVISNADRVILPGVGEAKSAMESLIQTGLDQLIPNLTQPVLGICLGMQLMCKTSDEGNTICLGIFENTVKRFPSLLPIPHMGWNNFTSVQGGLFNSIDPSEDVYFVHSYYATLDASTSAKTEYIVPFSAALEKNNFFGTQFHPEKSALIGQKIFQNFLAL